VPVATPDLPGEGRSIAGQGSPRFDAEKRAKKFKKGVAMGWASE